MSADGIALFYLARGADADFLGSIRRFIRGYRSRPAGVGHELVVIFKGFASRDALDEARSSLAGVAFQEVHTGDETFDLGAYADAILRVDCDRAAFLNTASEPIASHWLAKLNAALDLPGMGLVGATGSFEGGPTRGTFPNIHVRTNAFMMRTPLARRTLRTPDDQEQTRRALRRAWAQQPDPAGRLTRPFGRGRGSQWPRLCSRMVERQPDLPSGESRQSAGRRQPDARVGRADMAGARILYESTWGAIRSPTRPFGEPRS